MKHTIGKTTPYPSTPINLQFRFPTVGPIRPAMQSRPLAVKPIRTAASLPRPTNAKAASTSDKTEEQVPCQELDGKEQRWPFEAEQTREPGDLANDEKDGG